MLKLNKIAALILLFANSLLNLHAQETDTNTTVNSADTSKYISEEEFYYANTKRFTMTGELPLRETEIRWVPAAVVGSAYAAVFYAQHVGQIQTIWDEMGEFHFKEDGQYALWADKAGHFFGTYYASYIWSEALMVAGFSWDASSIIGGVLGLAYNSYVEVLDGFAVSWGFSPSDFYADMAGAAFFVGQHYWPFLQNFTPKFTYVPAPWHGDRHRVPSDMFIDDYSSHTLWLSVNVHNLLPYNYQNYWPDWLELSFGYAVRNLCDAGHPGLHNCSDEDAELYITDDGWQVYGSKRYVIGLDYNLVKLIPDSWNFLNWIKQSANYLKFPAPAFEFGDESRFYLLYPFKIDIGIKL